jgi:lipoyl synthase
MLRVRWLGRVAYGEALALQNGLFDHGRQNHLLLLEHPHVFTHGKRADLARNVLVDPKSVGAELVAVQRGGDVTYHGPGQLVGYPILTLTSKFSPDAALADTVAYVRQVEQLIIDTLGELGIRTAGRLADYPGVWIDPHTDHPRKICAIGVRVSRGRTMHGFALNIDPDLRYMRDYIIPCGIADKAVTSLSEEGVDVSMERVVDVIARRAADIWGSPLPHHRRIERQDVAWRHQPEDLAAFSRGDGPGVTVRDARDHRSPQSVDATSPRLRGRLEQAGVTSGLSIATRKPEWLRPRVKIDGAVLGLKQTIRDLRLTTVCEQAGCPNLSECWADGTATFMVLGERCTRACGFCLVDTQKPLAVDADEPRRVAEAVDRMGLAHAVLTMVARDDLADGGMDLVAATVLAIRALRPKTTVETLVSDGKGDTASFRRLFEVRPDIFNHNVETVARLQRAVRPSAGYARSLGVLAAAKRAGLTTKSGLIVGMGETIDELEGALADLAGIGVDIVTIGQYLRPTSHHLPVARWVEPPEFDQLKLLGESLGIGHVESSPLTRSSYHAGQAAAAVRRVSIS